MCSGFRLSGLGLKGFEFGSERFRFIGFGSATGYLLVFILLFNVL